LRAARRLQPKEINNFSVINKHVTQGFDAVFVGINIGGWIIGGFSILVGVLGLQISCCFSEGTDKYYWYSESSRS